MFSEGDAAVRDACFRSAVNDYQVALRLKPDDYHTYWNLGWVLYLLGDYEHAVDATEEAARLAPLKAFGARLVQANSLLGEWANGKKGWRNVGPPSNTQPLIR